MKQEFEMTDADLDKMKSIASQSAPVMMIGGVDLSQGRQMSANEFWKELGDRLGFVWDSCEGSAKGIKYFLATPKPKVIPKTQTEIEMDKYDTLPKIIEQLELCNYEAEGGYLKNNVAFLSLKRMATKH